MVIHTIYKNFRRCKQFIRFLTYGGFALMLGFTVSCAHAKKFIPKPAERLSKEWQKKIRKDAKAFGISDELLNKALPSVVLLPRVVELDRKQPYKIKSFNKYVSDVIPQSRTNNALKNYRANRDLLEKIGKEYGVQPRFIVALWGIESNFGQNMGGFPIIDSLATLTVDGRRQKFFGKELLNALKIVDDGHISLQKMQGSWAGAMGQTQFMPSSFLELAVDYNKDGKRDIWGTKADVFASIANYLSKRGWDESTTWGREVKLPKSFDFNLVGKKTKKTIKEWDNIGITSTAGGELPLARPELKASIVKPDDNGSRYFLVYENYRTILKWNRSLYFATTVGMLADRIKSNL